MATAMSFGTPNFSGLLFRKGVEETPFSTMIGANPRSVNHVEFVTGQYYTAIQGSQPNISESASLTAPDAVVHTRSQLINVTQIFQERVSVSYAKESNMGQMDGVNIANQLANPQSELNFQIQRAMAKISQDIEYTFINGVYNRATNDTEVNKSRGILTAITTNGQKYYLEDLVYDNGSPYTLDELNAQCLLRNKVQMCQFESNKEGSRTGNEVQKIIDANGGRCSITKKYTTQNKETKIIVNSDWVKKHIVFKDASEQSEMYRKFMQSVYSYVQMGKNKHDDSVDALAMLALYSQSYPFEEQSPLFFFTFRML